MWAWKHSLNPNSIAESKYLKMKGLIIILVAWKTRFGAKIWKGDLLFDNDKQKHLLKKLRKMIKKQQILKEKHVMD